MQYRTSRQEVTGLVVNRKINVRREYQHAARAMVHSLLNKGYFEIYAPNAATSPPTMEVRRGSPNELHGMLGFIDRIELDSTAKDKKKFFKDEKDLSSKGTTYRDFLLFQNFYANERPVVLCEGETDNVYLTHAIRGLAMGYPLLGTIDVNGKVSINVRLYKYRKSSTARILSLREGGSSALANFVTTYKKQSAKFKAPGQAHPVIILYDNDSGAKKLESVIKQVVGQTTNLTSPFVCITRNLYAVAVPVPTGATESKIEDLFDQTVKSTILDGKSFDAHNNFDKATHYGKKDFAYRVVRQNAASINFDGFRPLLDIFVAVINAHTARINTAAPTAP
jgi:hypothetical protein